MTDRDHFAAAALSGLLAASDANSWADDLWADDLCRTAYGWADAMLHQRGDHIADAGKIAEKPKHTQPHTPQSDRLTEWERHASHRWGLGVASDLYDLECRVAALEKVNHDAVPAAIAQTDADRGRTDKADSRPGEGTGNTPRPKPINDCVSDRSKPINGPYPDSRVWETPVHTPAPHATPGECSVPRDGTEPVAWAVAGDYGDYAVALFSDKASAQTEADRRALVGLRPGYVVIPLYRHPPRQTLTEIEAETLRELRDEAAQYADEIGLTSSEIRARQRIIDGLLERLGGGR